MNGEQYLRSIESSLGIIKLNKVIDEKYQKLCKMLSNVEIENYFYQYKINGSTIQFEIMFFSKKTIYDFVISSNSIEECFLRISDVSTLSISTTSPIVNKEDQVSVVESQRCSLKINTISNGVLSYETYSVVGIEQLEGVRNSLLKLIY
jgi:hypothetical protein